MESKRYSHSFINYLRAVLQERIKKNPRYSLRAFAKSLNTSPGHISKLLNNQVDLTDQSFEKILTSLKLTEWEISYHRETFKVDKLRHRDKLVSIDRTSPHLVDWLRYYSEEDHLLLLKFFDGKSLKYDINEISQRVGLDPSRSQIIVDRLLRLGLLTVKAGFLQPRLHPGSRELHFVPIEGKDISQVKLVLNMSIPSERIEELDHLLNKVNLFSYYSDGLSLESEERQLKDKTAG